MGTGKSILTPDETARLFRMYDEAVQEQHRVDRVLYEANLLPDRKGYYKNR